MGLPSEGEPGLGVEAKPTLEGTTEPTTAVRFLRSAIASGISQGWRILVTFGASLLLRRLISPADYGLFDWSVVVFLVLGAVRDLGLAHHVLRVEPRPFANLLVLQVIWGSCLALGVFFAAPSIAASFEYGHPEMVGVMRAMALFMVLEGLSLVPRYYFDGELAVQKAVLPEVLRNLCWVTVAITLAFRGAGVWSLVWGQVVGVFVYVVFMWWRAWPTIPLRYQKGRMPELLRASAPLAVVWFLVILIQQIDPIVLSLRFPFDDVGFYTFAYQWATILSVQILLPTVARALYPTLLVLVDDPPELFRAFAFSSRTILAVEVVAAYFLFVNAESVLAIVGGDQWTEAPAYLRILCFAPLVDPFTRLGGEVLKAKHLDSVWIFASILTVLSFGVGGFLLTGALGPVGMAWINLLPLGAFVMGWALHKLHPPGFWRFCADLPWVYLIPLPGFLAVSWVAPQEGFARMALSLLAALLAVGLLAWRFGPETVAWFRSRPHQESADDSEVD